MVRPFKTFIKICFGRTFLTDTCEDKVVNNYHFQGEYCTFERECSPPVTAAAHVFRNIPRNDDYHHRIIIIGKTTCLDDNLRPLLKMLITNRGHIEFTIVTPSFDVFHTFIFHMLILFIFVLFIHIFICCRFVSFEFIVS